MSTLARGEGAGSGIVTVAFGGASSAPTASADSFATTMLRDGSRNPNRAR
jgi:hypothetical protein